MFAGSGKFARTLACAAAVLAAASVAAAPAEAKNGRNAALAAGIIGGAVLGLALGAGHAQPVYEDDVVVVRPRRRCQRQTVLVGYDHWDRPVYERVRVCAR